MSADQERAGNKGVKAGNEPDTVNAREKDKLISELRNRVALLENELRSRQENVTPGGIVKCKGAEDALQERIKELTAMYLAMEIVQQQKPVSELLQEVVFILPAAWQYPEITAARIWFDGKEYRTPGYSSARWAQSARFSTNDAREGFIEIVYLEERPGEAEGPFLTEERNLINSLAQILEIFLNRRISEDALRESEVKFRRMAESIDEVFFIVTPDWQRPIYISPKYEKIMGLKVQDIYRDNSLWLKAIVPEDRPIIEDLIARQIRGEFDDKFTVEFRSKRADGSILWVYGNSYPIFDENGNVQMITVTASDITERKRTEEKLRASLESLARAQEIAHLGNWSWDIRTNEQEWSDESYRIFGFEPGEVRPDYDLYMGLLHPEDRARMLAGTKNLLEKNMPYNIDYRIIHRDGSVRHIHSEGQIARDEKGRPLRMFGINQDITERKRISSILEKYRFFLENARDIVLFVRRDGRIIEANQAAVKAYGYTREELLSLTIYDLRTTDPGHHVDEQMDMAYDKGILFEALHCRKDGSSFPVEVSSQGRIIDGEKVLFSIVRDITERKQAEAALRESEVFLSNVFRSIQDGISVLDKDLNVLRVNHAMEKWYAHNMPLVGKKCYEVYHGRSEPCERCPSLRTIKSRTMHSEVVPLVGASGSVGWVELYTFPLLDKGGNVIGIIEHVRDITERKRAEEALRESEEKFRLLSETSPAAIFVYQDDRYVYLNPAMETIHGFSRDELMKKSPMDVIHPDIKAEIEAVYMNPAYPPVRREVKLLTKDGGIRWVYSSSTPILYNNRPARMVIAFDITERKWAEEALLDSEARFKAFLDNSAVLAWMKDEGGRFTFLSSNYEKRFGVRFEDWRGKTDFDLRPPEMAAKFRENDLAVLKSGKPTEVFEEANNPDGSSSWWLSNKFPFVDSSGKKYVGGLGVDITERKQAEEALQKNEEMLRHIIDASPIPMVLYSESENYYFYNKKFHETFGFTSEDVPSINEWWLLAYPDERYRDLVKKRWYAAVDKAIQNKSSIVPQEVEVTCKDGSKRHILAEFSSIGRINLSVLYDITERKRAEEAMQESEERYRGLFESSIDGIIITDMSGNIIKVNAAYQEMLGYSEEELQHLTYQHLTPAKWHDIEERIVQELIIGRGYSDEYEKEYIRKDGSIFPISIRVWLTKDKEGHSQGMWGIIRDITERKRAEEALRESEQKFSALADNIPNLAWMANADGWIFWYNKQWYDYTGTTLEEMQGWGWQKVHHPDYVKAVTEEWSTRIKEGKPYDNIFPLRGKYGNYRWFLTRVTPIRDEHGNILRWFGTNTDITDRKNAEEALKEAKMQAELYLDLMGHDISNMHQIIMGNLEIAQGVLEVDGRLEGGDKEMIDISLATLQRSATLIKNIRNLQKIRSGKYRFEKMDLGEVLCETINIYIGLPGRDVIISYERVPGCYVLANPLLKDIFINLIDNAVKHCSDPVRINVGLAPVDQNGSHYYRVVVEDNGRGIPDDMKSTIFSRLNRGKSIAMGTGLGLYIVKTLVEGFGGTISVEDRVPGDHTKGVKFVVMLPSVN